MLLAGEEVEDWAAAEEDEEERGWVLADPLVLPAGSE
jgi:hypothetical protein